MSQVAPAGEQQHDLPALLKQGLSDAEIESLLKEKYKDVFMVRNLMKEVKQIRNAQKNTTGLVLIAIGAALMLLSSVLSLSGSLSSGSSWYFLFGLTTIGVIIVFAGLIQIFG